MIDKDFFRDRPTAYADPGSVWALSGHVGMYSGATYTAQSCCRVSTRQIYRAAGIDKRERDGRALWAEREVEGLYRAKWEEEERASPHVFPSRPSVQDWMSGAPYTKARDTLKARGEARGYHAKRNIKFALLDTLNASFRELNAGTGKRPVLVIGKEGKSNRGVRGARGFFSRELIEFLSEFFLVLLLDENNTSKLTPCCHTESVFANDHEMRSKCCQRCTVTFAVKKPIFKGEQTRTMRFSYDRDLAASINFAYVAIFMAATGKRPSSFARSTPTGP